MGYRRRHLPTLNIQGSCNNLCDTAPDPAEFAARNAANIVWLRETFAHAAERGSAAIMLITQGNPGWDPSDPTRAPLRNARTLAQTDGQPDGFLEFLGALRAEVIAFRRPVAYVHGDSHYFRVDKPFLDSAGRRLENFTRVETFGNNPANGTNDVQWVKGGRRRQEPRGVLVRATDRSWQSRRRAAAVRGWALWRCQSNEGAP